MKLRKYTVLSILFLTFSLFGEETDGRKLSLDKLREIRRETERSFIAELSASSNFTSQAKFEISRKFRAKMLGIAFAKSYCGTNIVKDVNFDTSTDMLFITFENGNVMSNKINRTNKVESKR